MAYRVSFVTCEENDPYSKAGQDLDPDNPRLCYVLSGICNQPSILAYFFVVFAPNSMTFASDPRVVVGYMEHPH